MSQIPTQRYPSKGCLWELLHSLWIYWTLTFMAFISFFYIGSKMRHRRCLIWGAVYLVVFIMIFSFVDQDQNEESNSAIGGILTLYWLGSIVHAFVARSEYLQMLLRDEAETQRYYREQYYEQQRASQFAGEYQTRQQQQGRSAFSDHSYTAQPKQSPAAAAADIPMTDINTCTVKELAALPGVTIVMAKQAYKYRCEHNGFSSAEEFFQVTGLKPHFVAMLQSKLVCSHTSQQPDSSFTDYTGTDDTGNTPPHTGRKLDL